MHPEFSPALPCGFAGCPELATRTVETRSPIGRRFEWLCARHATRRAELEAVLNDQPIPFTLTAKGRAAVAGAA